MKYRGAVRKNRKGETAVLYTPNTRCGWSTRATGETAAGMMFCPEIVDLVLNRTHATMRRDCAEIERLAKKKWPKVSLESIQPFYAVCCLKVEWVPKGAMFKIIPGYMDCEVIEVASPKTHWEV